MGKREELERISEKIESYFKEYQCSDAVSESVIEVLEESLEILSKSTKKRKKINDILEKCRVYISQDYTINRTPKIYENEIERYFYAVIGRPHWYIEEEISNVDGVLYYEFHDNMKRLEKLKQKDGVLFKVIKFGKKWTPIIMAENIHFYED